MLIALVAIALLIVSVAAIYFLLKSMGQDGVEVAAPGSCKSGGCGVRNRATSETRCHQAEDQVGEPNEIEGMSDLDQQHADAKRQSSRLR